MKLIKLTQGKFAQVDDEDYERLNKFKWQCKQPRKDKFYACRSFLIKGVYKTIGMHRYIMKVVYSKKFIDHEDGNGLNNQKVNLRKCTVAQNRMNSILTKTAGSSRFKGVCLNKKLKHWNSTIKFKQKTITLGYFPTQEEAALAYNLKASELFGEFARLNIIPKSTTLSKAGKHIKHLIQ